ncbi:cytochrome P450 [Bacillus paralicheniformis]|uniref:cytochrome P450 n=1 Tax=Bacillus paralicheniformis TaxID=1648923 RepID=UPI00131A03AB|nr:cytochrome P450 [Bacillus paralicheniformis]
MTNKSKEHVVISELTGLRTDEEKFEPFVWFKQMRHSRPVFYDEKQSVWNVFLYDDVKRVQEDKEYFSTDIQSKRPGIYNLSILNTDPPRHTELRNLVSRAFTPSVLSSWVPRYEAIVSELIDQMEGQEVVDIVENFTFPLPVIIIAEMLGIPAEDRKQFKQWSNDLILFPQVYSPEEFQRLNRIKMNAAKEVIEYFGEIINIKRKHPKEDMISNLIQSEEKGVRLSQEDLMQFCILLLIAGNETTTNLLTNAIYSYDENNLIPFLNANPVKIPASVEEVLRYRAPIQCINRIVKKDTELGGQQLKADDYVLAWIASGNRDEQYFNDPDRFIIDRDFNKHLTFGKGIHTCLGAPLARMQAKLGLTELIRRFPNLRIHEDYKIDLIPIGFSLGLKTLPLRLNG